MHRVILLSLIAVLVPAAPAGAVPTDTTVRTIQDTDGDNLLEFAPGEPHVVIGGPEGFRPPKHGSIVNFLQLSDFQIVDEESPGRVEFLDTTQRGPFAPFSAAYRPMESLTTHVAEAMVRAARDTVSPLTQAHLDLAVLTGDNADSQQYNETRWFVEVLDGGTEVHPDSGVPTDECPGRADSVYDGVRGGGPLGYYEPDASGDGEDGVGYSPDREENLSTTGRDVTVRDFPGLFEAANSPFRSLGLGMPWYSAFGNHDALVQGNSPDAYVGPFGGSGEASNPAYQGIVTGCAKPVALLDPEELIGDPMGGVIVPPDARRCFLAKDDPVSGPPGTPCEDSSFIGEHFVTTGDPVGHGFAPTSALSPEEQAAAYGRPFPAVLNHDGYYSLSPAGGLRFVVLDTVTDECGSIFCSEGSVDHAQFLWLEEQMRTAAERGQYVLVFSHHTLRTTRLPSTDATEQPIHFGQRVDRDNPGNPQSSSPAETLEELFCRHDNVLAHVAGHEHENYLRHHTCEEDSPPTSGPGDFWEISTAAHIDWPQQARMIELVDNRDGTMSLVLTILDHAGPPNPGNAQASLTAKGGSGGQVLKLASIARELAFNDYQGSRGARGEPEDRNAIIVVDRAWPYGG